MLALYQWPGPQQRLKSKQGKPGNRFLPLLGILLFGLSHCALLLQKPAPTPRFVFDTANVLSDIEALAVDAQLVDINQETGAEVVVLTILSTNGVPIEQYASRKANDLGIGREGIDDGILILIALKDRTVRIAVGRGLENTVTDIQARAILNQRMLPEFRNGHFAAGLTRGIIRLKELIPLANLPPPAAKK
ncbi:MAG: TPM domain-containing protein [Leptospiraceae bacterium]|nr:TPM domain-containing protein [Leptospiraceae bacterium]